ncbi:protein kinase [Nonomuraea sp. NPDC050790]|uniref:serine/threonine-protein kinase n=1 Tax=Nonomuraea sp. NPDC050790 TaxID=3364371 RepID=UPI0037A39458
MQVPGYTEIRELGHGGTGQVMLAVRTSDGLPVAIKHLSPRLREDKELVARFRDEARVIAELDSPHTVRLHEYVEGEDDAAIVMELVDGITLRRLLTHEGATGAEAALAVLKGALTGLAAAHGRGVVHRDFKPENVIVTADGGSKLVDFGLAARFGEAGTYVGTPSYMAPEQWEDAPAGPATDVYAASVVFFECLTGHRPFPGEDPAVLAYQHQNVPPPLANVDERVRELVEFGMAKDPAERPPSAAAFLRELERVAGRAYGSGWERRGRAGLGLLTIPHIALLPLVPSAGAEVATGFARSTLSPVTKFAVASGLIAATAAAVVSVFVMWTEDPPIETARALPPVSSGPLSPPATGLERTPGPSTGSPSMPPATTITDPGEHPGTAGVPTDPVTVAGEPTRTLEPTREPGRTPGRTAEPTRSHARDDDPTRGPEPAEPTKGEPTKGEPTKGEPTRAEPTKPPPATQPPPSNGEPPGKKPEPLLSVSLKVSVDLPVLKGGDQLLDADLGLGLGSSLLGMAVLPGSVLLGRHLAARKARENRHLTAGEARENRHLTVRKARGSRHQGDTE